MKYLILLFFCQTVFAQDGKIRLFFFGGVGFDQTKANIWNDKLTKLPELTHYEFESIEFPSKDLRYPRASKDSRPQIAKMVAEINAHPEQRFTLVGHSSGSVLAIEIARLVRKPSQIKLVILDGFIPPEDLQTKIDVTCWGAISQENKKKVSRNYETLKACKKFREISVKSCSTETCLHYVFLDQEASNNKTKLPIDYDSFKANTFWLKSQ